mgnify:CR=1 FL=1
MVERTEDGGLKPYVMDFGLARDWNDGATETGTVLGTPHYMSPEQARGEVGGLDRRADVYSLGATLYHLLTGKPPIPGNNPLEILNQIATFEPRPPRQLNSDLPPDLEAIALQCLEKDRSARYESARALAEDLERFLSGEPVAARRAARPLYRLRKRLRKHWRLAAAATVTLTLLLLSFGWGALGRREAAARELLARRFTESVKDIEAMARYSALAPLHDTRDDRRAMKAMMAALESEIKRAGATAVGPGQYALGRGHLALDDDELARVHLEAAWKHGFREPGAAYALALALGHLYKNQLRQLERERLINPKLAGKHRHEIEKRYRDRALSYLKQSASADVPSSAYVMALIAYYEERFDDALRHLDAVGSSLPWFYEAPELRGDIFLARAQHQKWAGNGERALADLEAGRKAYVVAASIGESAPAVHQALGELEYAAMITGIYGEGDALQAFSRGVAAADRALRALPGRYTALLLDARFRRNLAQYRSHQGGRVEELLAQAITGVQKAIEAAPVRPEARLELLRIYQQWGEAREARSEDPRPQLGKAVDIAETIRPADRTYEYYLDGGLIYKIWADYEDQIGLNSRHNRDKAIESYTKALEINDQGPDVLMDLGINYYQRASQPRSADAERDLKEAMAALTKAKESAPKHIVPYFYKGQIHILSAQRLRARGGEPAAELTQALSEFQAGLTINPRLPHLHNGAGSVRIEQAHDAWEHGRSPDALLEQAVASYKQAIAVAPEQANGYSNIGSALLERAYFDLARAQDPSPRVSEAVAVVKKGLAQAPDLADAWVNLSWAYTIAAEYALLQGGDPRPSLNEAAVAIENALKHNPSSGEAWLYRGSVRATTAQQRARRGQGRDEDFTAAVRAYQQAIELSPDQPEYRLPLGHFCREWAQWRKEARQDPQPALALGAEQAERLLAARAQWPDAQVLRASLQLVRAQLSESSEARGAAAAQAAADFTAALAANGNLAARWQAAADKAQRLAAGAR